MTDYCSVKSRDATPECDSSTGTRITFLATHSSRILAMGDIDHISQLPLWAYKGASMVAGPLLSLPMPRLPQPPRLQTTTPRPMLQHDQVESIAKGLAVANISDSDYGKKTRRLIRLITDIRAFG